MHFDRIGEGEWQHWWVSPIRQEVLWGLGGTSGFVMSAKGTLVCFIVFGKRWLFWVNITSNWSRESEAWVRKTSEALPRNHVFWRIQGKYKFPAACQKSLHKLTSYLFQLSSRLIMQPQCSLFYGEEHKSHFHLLLQLGEPWGRREQPQQLWPPSYPKHMRLEKVLEPP